MHVRSATSAALALSLVLLFPAVILEKLSSHVLWKMGVIVKQLCLTGRGMSLRALSQNPPAVGSALLSFKPPSCLSQLLQLLWSRVRPSDRRWPSWVPNPVERRLGRWEHVKVAAFHTLLSERPLTTEFCFLCACKQLFPFGLTFMWWWDTSAASATTSSNSWKQEPPGATKPLVSDF